jgi:hypothetical protein
MNEFLSKFFYWSNQVKMYHLQTKVYPMHVALGSLYEALTEFTDDFSEKYMSNGEVLSAPMNIKKLADYRDLSQVYATVDEIDQYISVLRTELVDATDLVNMLDDLRGHLNKVRYLLTLS